jgi:hypothetical protein
MLLVEKISPSRIKTFDQCKFKYWLTYHTEEELCSNFGAANGTLIHDILRRRALGEQVDWMRDLYHGYQGILSSINNFNEEEILDSPLRWAKAKQFRDQKPFCDSCPFKGPALRDASCSHQCIISGEPLNALSGCPKGLFELSIQLTKDALAKYEPIFAQQKIIGVEFDCEGVEIPGADCLFKGFLDLVTEEDSDTVHITDYKSGKWTQDYDECRKDIQIRGYSWAARKIFVEDVLDNGYKYKHVMLTFDYFQGRPITLAFSAEEDAKTEAWLRDKVEEIRQTSWIYRVIGKRRFDWKCKAMCDTEVCERMWNGEFETDGQSD